MRGHASKIRNHFGWAVVRETLARDHLAGYALVLSSALEPKWSRPGHRVLNRPSWPITLTGIQLLLSRRPLLQSRPPFPLSRQRRTLLSRSDQAGGDQGRQALLGASCRHSRQFHWRSEVDCVTAIQRSSCLLAASIYKGRLFHKAAAT